MSIMVDKKHSRINRYQPIIKRQEIIINHHSPIINPSLIHHATLLNPSVTDHFTLNQAFFATLHGPVRPETILAEFRPRLDTRNLLGKLKAFATTVMGAQGALG